MPRFSESFLDELKKLGAEILATTNPWEIARFKTIYGVGVIYQNKRGVETWSAEAKKAYQHVMSHQGRIGHIKPKGRRTNRTSMLALKERDGWECFFSGLDLEDDCTIEHLVPIAHGGPNHISNLVLAHAECNQAAGHASGAEKLKLALKMRGIEYGPEETD